MNREFLKALGLEDETIEKVMAEHGRTLNDTKGQLDTVTTERDNLKEQLTDRDTQLNDLSDKVKDSEDLTAEINRLKDENKSTAKELQDKLKQQAFEHRLENSLKDANVRNTKAVKALLDTEKIKLDGEKLLNLDDQLEALRESDAYLFEEDQQQQTKPNFTVGNHVKGSNVLSKEQIMQEPDNKKRQKMIKENSHLFR